MWPLQAARQALERQHALERTQLQQALRGWFNPGKLGVGPSALVPQTSSPRHDLSRLLSHSHSQNQTHSHPASPRRSQQLNLQPSAERPKSPPKRPTTAPVARHGTVGPDGKLRVRVHFDSDGDSSSSSSYSSSGTSNAEMPVAEWPDSPIDG